VDVPNHYDLSSDPEYRDVLKNPDKFLEECSDEVYMAFHQLSTAQRSCILLRSAEKYSYKEIASIMDIPVGTVMTHLARGRAKLRKELTEYARTRGLVRKMPRIMPKKDSADPERRVENGSEK